MNRLLNLILSKSFLPLFAAFALAALGWRSFRTLPVDVFPDIAVPRVVLQSEAPGLTAEEVEQRVTMPLESAAESSLWHVVDDNCYLNFVNLTNPPACEYRMEEQDGRRACSTTDSPRFHPETHGIWYNSKRNNMTRKAEKDQTRRKEAKWQKTG